MTSSGFRILAWVKGVGWTMSLRRLLLALVSMVSVHPRARNGKESDSFTPYCANLLRSSGCVEGTSDRRGRFTGERDKLGRGLREGQFCIGLKGLGVRCE